MSRNTNRKMYSLFCVFNVNLNQLSFGFVFNDIEDAKQISFEVMNTSLRLSIDSKHTLFTFTDCIELTPNSLRQLNAFRSTNNKQNVCLNRCLEIGFTVSAQLGLYLDVRLVHLIVILIYLQLWCQTNSHSLRLLCRSTRN